jgi:uncharacterized metal-binding protein YceD (DUF177 family)
MTISFRSIYAGTKEVENHLFGEDFDITLKGRVSKGADGMVLLDASLNGELRLECDLCGESYVERLDENVKLKITDRAYKNSNSSEDEQDYDIIEFLDGEIDLDEIIQSEINSIKLDYHKCSNCK